MRSEHLRMLSHTRAYAVGFTEACMRSEHLFAYTLYKMGIFLFAYIAYKLYKKPMRSEHLFAYTHIRWASVCIHAISEAHLLNDACKNLRRS